MTSQMQRGNIHRSLLKFHQLEMIQLDLSHWGQQVPLPLQRMIITELRVYCPTVNIIFIWLGRHL